ncbi:hypothetical protein [Pseudoxanthomonas sp. USHLN014]|uniref:hypothetical protein n=1 Tax=Pseudoxanthomonas sp. USHLN014 TaxID=3081297 RepID=UPI00301C21D9
MTKVAEIVGSALALLRVTDASEAPEAEDMATGISVLNMMAKTWEAGGYTIGWTPVANPDDDLASAPEADEALIYNLAVKLRPRYGQALEPDVVDQARRLKADVLAAVFAANPMEMPRGIPGWRSRYNIRSDGYDF